MTQPDGANPSGAKNPTHAGAFADWATLTEADIADRSKAPLVGPTGSYTQLQQDVGADDGNVLPTRQGLWSTYARDADPSFPRILLVPKAERTGSGGSGDSAHTHSIVYDDPPDYQPDGNGANLTGLTFIECSKDRSYSRVTFGTGNSVTALGLTAMYAMAYLMDTNGDLHLQGTTGDIKSTIASTNREYTLDLPAFYEALKAEVWAVGLLQVTSAVQTCKSILALRQWPTTAPPGQRPAALYATSPASTTPLSTIAYSSLTFDAGIIPYCALS